MVRTSAVCQPWRSGDPVHLVLSGLRPRPDHDLVDVHVRGPGRDPPDDVGDVLRREWIRDAGVDGLGVLAVTGEPGERELVGPYHAGRDLRDPDGLTVDLQAQRSRQRLESVLGRRLSAAA